MPLLNIGEPGLDDVATDNVYFFMQSSDGARVRCAVTRPALVLLARGPMRTVADRTNTFATFRTTIERIASDKFDGGRIDHSGTVFVVQDDVRF